MARTDFDFVVVHLLSTLCVAGIAWAVRSANARKSSRDRAIGWWVFGGAVVGFFVGGIVERLAVNPDVYWGGTAWMGLVVGVVIGNIVGLGISDQQPARPAEGDQ